MIFKGDKLILQVKNNISVLKDNIEKITERRIGSIYKENKLIWVAIYDLVKSCFGSGYWLSDRSWMKDDFWKK